RERSPQLIQRDYPHYLALLGDLQTTNAELQKYADELLRVATARRTRWRDRVRRLVPWLREKPVKPAPPQEIAPSTPPPREIPAASSDECEAVSNERH